MSETTSSSSAASTILPIKKEIVPKINQVSTVVLYGVPIVSLVIENQERLCLAQISNTLLKQFSYNEIHNRRVALGITCVQCTPVQLEILRRAGAMPVSSRRCGMITRREAERLCKSFLGDNAPPRLPDDFSFAVFHECAWGCRGSFLPSRYNSSRAKCIKCILCGLFFSPNKFIFHSHRLTANDKYIQPDAANFNSWRRHMKLSGNPPEEIIHAWEDVKAMFNGGTRKRLLSSSSSSSHHHHHHSLKHDQHQNNAELQNHQPVVPSPRLASSSSHHHHHHHCPDLPIPAISRVAMDLICHKPLSFSSYSSSLSWLKRNPIIFPPDNPFFPSSSSSMEKTYQSAFKPVQPAMDSSRSNKSDEDSDNDVDIETTDDNTSQPSSTTIRNNWELKDENNKTRRISASNNTSPHHHHQQHQLNLTTNGQNEEIPCFTPKLWNFSRLSFDEAERASFLYRQDLHTRFLIGTSDESDRMLRNPTAIPLGIKPILDCNTCSTQSSSLYSLPPSENENKVT